MSSFQPKVYETTKSWELDIGHVVTRDEVQEVQRLLQNHVGCFAFSLKELGQLIGHEVRIVLKDDNPILK